MKPKLFIGSSKEGLNVANAIHTALSSDAECTVWNYAFPLSGNTLSSIMEAARASDFGAFVFTPDDIAEMRGERFLVARDNVLYELGLFTGHLTPNRCFFVLPDDVRVHIPSDLQGITSGIYEASRDDRDWNSAVGPFCNAIRAQIRKFGLAPEAIHERMRELAVKFECCEWIDNNNDRVKQKVAIVDEMTVFCKNNSVSKRRLLAQNRPGFNVALCTAIRANSSSQDAGIILGVKPEGFTRGVAQSTVIRTIDMLEKEKKIAKPDALDLTAWLGQLRNVHSDDQLRITELVARLK
jgi:hypothetical protein